MFCSTCLSFLTICYTAVRSFKEHVRVFGLNVNSLSQQTPAIVDRNGRLKVEQLTKTLSTAAI